jgi:hypothetical protein
LAYPAQSIRLRRAKFYRSAFGCTAVVLTISAIYLGIEARCRNKSAVTSPAGMGSGTLIMTTFDKREEGFERKFAHDEELKFKAEARRNKLLGLWVASKIGLSADEAKAYAREVVTADLEQTGGVIRKVVDDLTDNGIAISESELRVKMDELMAEAIMQVKAGT